MKKTGTVLVLIAIVGILMVSGCIGQRAVTILENDGLRISSFSAEPMTADVGDVIAFTAEIENVGFVDATDVQISLGGIENNWRTATGGLIADSNDFVKKYSKLFPPNPKYNQPGDVRVGSWIFKTPELPPGLEVDRSVDANILYNYKTTGSITLRAVGEQYLKTNYVAKGEVTISCIISVNKDLFMQRGIPDEPIILDFDLDYRYYLTQKVDVHMNSYE
ncbi:MAG: hypothetical protein V1870_04040 [Candidatus Aenigmatarchaeota archaeon]